MTQDQNHHPAGPGQRAGMSEAEPEGGRVSAVEQASMTPEEQESMTRKLLEKLDEKLDAALLQRGEPEGATAFAASPIARVDLAGLEGEHPEGDSGATVRSPTFDERAAAAPPPEPLLASPPPEPDSPPLDARQAGPLKGRLPEELTITMEFTVPAELLAQLGKLPFTPPTPGSELARTLQVPVLDLMKGQTAPLGDDSIQKAVAALPFIGERVDAGLVFFPRLSIQQYASLCAELALWPERSGEILRRYHVMNEAAPRALFEHWQAELAASPEARAAFEEHLASYTAWLRAQGGSPGR